MRASAKSLLKSFSVAGLPLLVAHLGLLWTFDLAARPWLTLCWLLLGMAGLVFAVNRLRGSSPMPVVTLLAIAGLFRVLLLPLPPTLSDDILRYVWDGRVAGTGLNPYSLVPDSPILEPLRDELWRQLPHREVATVYPPLALAVFSIAARFPAPIIVLKTVLTMADLLGCWFLVALAERSRICRERTLWYLWNPLASLEIAGMGHVDSLGISAAIAAVWLLVGRRPRTRSSSVAAAAGVLAKLVPLVGFPLWARRSGRPWVFVAVGGGLVVTALLPVLVACGGIPPGYVEYGISWEFNGPLFEPLWRLFDSLNVPEGVASLLDWLKRTTGVHEFWNRFYPFNYPQFLAKVILASAALPLLLRAWRSRDPVGGTGMAFGVFLLFSATVYPWYVLWTLPWAALCQQPAWLALSALILLSYIPQFTEIPLMPLVFAAIWVPFFAILWRRPRWSGD
jgi:hypothetical protein